MVTEAIKSVATIIFRGDEVLMVRSGIASDHPLGICGLPAGKVEVEKGETWEEAAVRECEEETGITPRKLIKLPTFYDANLARKDGISRHYCCWSFYAPEYEGKLRSTDEAEPFWWKISELNKLSLVNNVDKMIAEADVERKSGQIK